MPYVPYTLPGGNDPDTLMQRALQELAARIPGYRAYAGHPEVVLGETIAAIQSETRQLQAAVGAPVYRHWGETGIRLPRILGTNATATATFTLADSAGHTIPANTQLLWTDGAGNRLTLSTIADVDVPAASSTATGVVVQVDEPGTVGNRVTAGAVQIIDSSAFMDSAVLTSPATGGVDDESDSDYLDRLSDVLQSFGETAVTVDDFQRLSRNVAGVDRAFVIDGWAPVGDTLNNEKTVGIVAVDSAGAALAGGVKTALDAYLQSLREVNFVVAVADPIYTDVTVIFTATADAGRNPLDVKANAEAAAYNYLDPATWGSTGGAHSWDGNKIVSRLTLATVIGSADGVDRLLTMSINGSASADLTLTGRVALPSSQADGTTVTGTVT